MEATVTPPSAITNSTPVAQRGPPLRYSNTQPGQPCSCCSKLTDEVARHEIKLMVKVATSIGKGSINVDNIYHLPQCNTRDEVLNIDNCGEEEFERMVSGFELVQMPKSDPQRTPTNPSQLVR